MNKILTLFLEVHQQYVFIENNTLNDIKIFIFIKIKNFTSILKKSQAFKKCILFLTYSNNEYIVNHKENK